MSVFENRVLKRIFVTKRDEVTEDLRKLYNKELHNFFFIWYIGGWSPIGSTRHCGHQQAYCASPV
jgi:hypothetical protein